MKLTGAEILLECLLEQGVDTIFGYPGGTVLYIYDALYKYKDKITHYLTAHEQGAAHAADGYARATGKAGVCLATSGPGATNLVTGIATAYMDSVPLVAITGNVPVSLLGKDSFQEIDIFNITMPITKHNYIVKSVEDLADTVREAFYIAKEGRPGPVLIDIPKDVSNELCEYVAKTPEPILKKTASIDESDLQNAVDAIMNSKKPYIYGGGGVITAGAAEKLKVFAEKLDAPVCLSVMGLGGFPSSNPRYTGLIGMHGSKASNFAACECDLLIAVGARFSDRVIGNVKRFATNATILHLDIDPAEINKNVAAYHSVVGDVGEILERLNQRLPELSHPEWMNFVYKTKEENPLFYVRNGCLKPQQIIKRIGEIIRETGTDAVITTEVGQHQMWACQYIGYEKPRSFLTSGGLGTMGFGLGAAIGASVGTGKTVINIAGDGCFRMNNIELATAVEYDVPLIEVIINNHALGMVRQWQTMFYDKRYSHTSLNRTTDFAALAAAHKAAGFNVTTKEEFECAFRKALELKSPVVINCEVSDEDKVFPMVPPGAGIDEIVTEDMR